MRINTLIFFFAALMALAALAFGPQRAQAAVTEAWIHRYSNVVSNSVDQAIKVVSDAVGDIIVTGTTANGITGQDMLTIKYSGADGSVLWQQRYNGPANFDDVPNAVGVDQSGNVVVTGSSQNAARAGFAYGDQSYYTAKYATMDGALLWEKRYSGPGNYYNSATAVALDGSGNVVVTGTSRKATALDEAGDLDYYTAKYAAEDGTLIWEKRYNSPRNGHDQANAVAVDRSGNVVVTGSSWNGDFLGHRDYYLAKYAAADGALLWENRYGQVSNGYPPRGAMAVDSNGNVAVTGSYYNGTDFDYYTAKYAANDGALLWEKRNHDPAANGYGVSWAVAVDSGGNVVVTRPSQKGTKADYYTAKYAAADGTLIWEKGYNGPANFDDVPNAVAVDGSGNVMVTGFSNNGSGDYTGNDYYTAKYAAADGTLIWEKRQLDPPNSIAGSSAVVVDGNGNVIMTGSFENTYYTAKYGAADGILLWEQRSKGPANHDDYPSAVAMDGRGNVVVTGTSDNGGNGEFYTAKYAAANGTLLWESRYGPGEAHGLAVDASGDVVVAGNSYNGADNPYYTAKYAAADGALLWAQRYNGPGVGSFANAVVTDGSGNVVVTGGVVSNVSSGNADIYTAKYSSADGTLLWQQRYNGPANGDDRAMALAVDASGNVVVTGSSQGDYYTTKYAAADGALLWQKRYNGPGNRDDQAAAVALDASGNVMVTGRSATGFSGQIYDYYTAKYAAVDGALLWERRYNGPANSSDYAEDIAVDDGGNVVVTGYSQGDYYTADYSGADGTLLWEKRGPAGVGSVVRLDGIGNVVVTGSSNNGSGFDFYTAKYAKTDGAILWEKRYNGFGNEDDFASGLAIGPNGEVVITGYSDGNFGPEATYDYATVVYREPLPPVSIELVPAGVRLRFTGSAGQSYSIQRAPAISGPWSTINTQTASASGLLEYLDTPPPPVSGFYRTVQP